MQGASTNSAEQARVTHSPDEGGFGGPDGPAAHVAPRLALLITSVVLLAFGFVAFSYLLAARLSPVRTTVALVLLVAVLGIQMALSFPHLVPRRLNRRRLVLLAVQTVLVFAPFPWFGQAWLPLPGLLAGSMLLVLREQWRAWTAFWLVVAGVDALEVAAGVGWRDLAYTSVSTVLSGLVTFGLSRLTDLVGEVHRSRAELAQLAVTQERLRFARDLHDLLGYSLSAVTLKCELAYRLAPRSVEQTRQELREVLEISRQALADVRTVAHGYRDMSIRAEVCQAREMLAMLGIRADVRVECGDLPPDVDTVLATVFREGLTNLLRHSGARQCEVEGVRREGRVCLRLANDGVLRPPPASLAAGAGSGGAGCGSNGLRNLMFRVESLGGHLTAGLRSDGWFEVRAEIPVPDGPPSRSASLAADAGDESRLDTEPAA